jgi:cytoskeletal protein RodZ
MTAASGVLLAVSGAVAGAVVTDRPGPTPMSLSLSAPAASPSAGPSSSTSPSSSPSSTPAVSSSAGEVEAAAQRAERRAEALRIRASADAARAARDAERDPRVAARAQLAEHGWGAGQFACLDALWTKESGWRHTARNASSGAYGIPQALPAGKLASAGADWQTNPVTQIRWGLGYIEDVYGSPCAAWSHSRAVNWY